jgi:hypothetical protein
LARLVEEADLSSLAPPERALLLGRLREHRAWKDLARDRDGSVRTTMRALREAVSLVAPTLSWGSLGESE